MELTDKDRFELAGQAASILNNLIADGVLIRPSVAIERLGVPRRTFYRDLERGRIPHWIVGGAEGERPALYVSAPWVAEQAQERKSNA